MRKMGKCGFANDQNGNPAVEKEIQVTKSIGLSYGEAVSRVVSDKLKPGEFEAEFAERFIDDNGRYIDRYDGQPFAYVKIIKV